MLPLISLLGLCVVMMLILMLATGLAAWWSEEFPPRE